MRDPNDIKAKELRIFGISLGVIVLVFFGVFFPWILSGSYPLWPWVFAGIIGVVTFIFPSLLKLIYLFTHALGQKLGQLYMFILLGFIFYFVVTPLGILIRAFGKNPFEKQLDHSITTYRKKSIAVPPKKMEMPF